MLRKRRSIRLPCYDYAWDGVYFVTFCTFGRECLFGRVENGVINLNSMGLIAQNLWMALPERFPRIRLDEFIVMPNHFHGIVHIMQSSVGAIHESPLQNDLRDRRRMLCQ